MKRTVTPQTPFFSIVVPSLNEERFLPLLLEDFSQQTFRNFEVVHVDGDSIDLTCEKAASFRDRISIQTLSVDRRNVSFQRNTGAAHARGEWVIFMDADGRVKPDFLAKLFQRLEDHPETDLFTCLVEAEQVSVFTKNIIELYNHILMMTVKLRPFSAGALIGIRRSKLEHVEFDCSAKMSEDHQFVGDAVKKGCTFRVFRQPRHSICLRRFEREGSLKVLIAYTRGLAVLLSGQKFDRFLPEYPMNGGSEYTDTAPDVHGFLPNIADIFRQTTQTQQQKLHLILTDFQKVISDVKKRP